MGIRTRAVALLLAASMLTLAACASPAAPAPASSDAATVPRPSTSSAAAPAATALDTIVLSLDGLVLQDANGHPLDSIGFDDGTALRDALTAALGAATTERNDRFALTSYDWGGIRLGLYDSPARASVSVTAPAVQGISIRTTDGIAVGSSRADLLAAGAQAGYDGRPAGGDETFQLATTPVPGTTSLSSPGTEGTRFILLLMDGDQVSGIQAPSDDFTDI